MVIAVQVTIDARHLEKTLSNIKTKLPVKMEIAIHNYAVITKESLQRQLLLGASKRGASSRIQIANQISTKKRSRFRYDVTIPRKAHLLDTMTPHYVSLKRGRDINRWAAKHFGNKTISGRSRIYRGPRGKIKGALYVTPDPFTVKGLKRVRHRLPKMLKKALDDTLKGV